jgi:hypothetical protein
VSTKVRYSKGQEQEPQGKNCGLDKIGQLSQTGGSAPQEGSHQERLLLQKRARKKAIGFPLASRLLRLPDTGDMKRSYQRQLRCGEKLVQGEAGDLKTYYCRNRSCIQCSSIRTARMISSYGEEVRSWGDNKFLVTLTIKNVTQSDLRSSIKGMAKDFRVCVKHLNYHHGKVKMVRSTEITYNRSSDTFHPHVHLLVQGYVPARDLMKHWVKITGSSILAQDLRKADEHSVLELFKYATKLVTEKKDENGKRVVVPAHAMHAMFSAIKGLRLIGAVGFKAKPDLVDEEGDFKLEQSTNSPTRLGEFVEWEWIQGFTDWVDYSTGEVLAEYEPSERAKDFIKQLDQEE